MAKNDKPTATKNNGGQGKPKDQAPSGTSASTDGKSSLKSTPGLEVISIRDGYRRAGMVWSKQATTVKLSDLTEDQVDQLIANCRIGADR